MLSEHVAQSAHTRYNASKASAHAPHSCPSPHTCHSLPYYLRVLPGGWGWVNHHSGVKGRKQCMHVSGKGCGSPTLDSSTLDSPTWTMFCSDELVCAQKQQSAAAAKLLESLVGWLAGCADWWCLLGGLTVLASRLEVPTGWAGWPPAGMWAGPLQNMCNPLTCRHTAPQGG